MATRGSLKTQIVSPKPETGERFQGMVCVDTASNPRIPVLMEMVGALSRASDPGDIQRIFGRGITRMEGEYGYISVSTRDLQAGEYRITSMRHIRSVEDVAPTNVDRWTHRDRLPVHKGGFLGSVIRSAYPELIHHLDVKGDPVIGDWLEPYGSLMALPLFDEGEPLNWAIILHKEPEGFTIDNLEQNILRSNLVGGTVRNVLAARRLHDANIRAQREVEKIAGIQRALLPQTIPSIPGLAIGTSYQTFDQAGGDHYGFRTVRRDRSGVEDPDGPWAILVADASGHGPAAAVVIAMMHAIVEAYPSIPCGPAEVLAHANSHLHAKRIESSFVTALLAFYDPATRKLTYSRAGHPPALHMRRERDGWNIERLDEVGSLPLSILDDVCYEEATVQLQPGETLVLYTDGITEATSPEGRMFGIEGIEHSLTECSGMPDCVIGHVTDALTDHLDGRRPDDDQTLVVMKLE